MHDVQAKACLSLHNLSLAQKGPYLGGIVVNFCQLQTLFGFLNNLHSYMALHVYGTSYSTTKCSVPVPTGHHLAKIDDKVILALDKCVK